MPKLIINPTSSARRDVPLAGTLLSIGRDPTNDLVLPDALVSRRHAVIECRAGKYVLRDCNSSNGSLVNGDRVTEHALKDGDLMAIGASRLLFREADAEELVAKVVPHPSAPKLNCPSCQADYRRGDGFCRRCGHELPSPVPPQAVCAQCGAQVPLPANFCNVCGGQLPREGFEPTRPRPILGPSLEASPAAPEAPAPLSDVDVVFESPPEQASPPLAAAAAMPTSQAGLGGVPKAMMPEVRPVPPPRPRTLEPAAAPRVPRPVPPRRAPDRRTSPSMTRETPAGFGPRLLAFMVDSLLVLLGQSVLVAPGVFYFYRWAAQSAAAPTEPGFVPILLSVTLVMVALLLGAGYYVYFWGVRGATPGKRMLGLVVQGAAGEFPIGIGRALLRLLGYALSGAVLGIGFLMVAFGGYGLHDRLASTRVVSQKGA